MSVYKHRLRMHLPSPTHRHSVSPHLQQAIKLTLEHQIHQHVPSPAVSTQQNLIAKTKQLLTLPQPHQRHPSTSYSQHRESSRLDPTRGSTSLARNRRESRLNQTKKQLELLNELYRNAQSHKVKRYRDELMMQQAEIHATIAQHNLRKTANPFSSYRHRQRLEAHVPELICSAEPKHEAPPVPDQPKLKANYNSQIDSLFDRIHPYRRLLLQRKKINGIEPWQVSNLN